MTIREKKKVLSKYPVFEQYLMDNEITEFRHIYDFVLAFDIEREALRFLIDQLGSLLDLACFLSLGDIINLSFWLNDEDFQLSENAKTVYFYKVIEILDCNACELAKRLIAAFDIKCAYAYAENDDEDVFIYVPINNEKATDVFGYSIKDVLDNADDIWGVTIE